MIVPGAFGDGFAEGPAQQAGGSPGQVIDHALKLAEVARLAKSGKKIQAIKLYRETFSVGLKEAKDAVEQIESGQMITYTYSTSHTDQFAHQTPASSNTRRGLPLRPHSARKVIWLVVGISLITVIGGAIAALVGFSSFFTPSRKILQTRTTPSTTQPAAPRAISAPAPAFADVALEFGSEGIGAGQFKDARSVAVDGEGRIYVGEYSGGRVQVFDSRGQFVTQWTTEKKAVLLNLAADRKGVVYVVHPGSIFRYEGPTGKLLGEVPNLLPSRFDYYTDVFVALDGSLIIGSNNSILRISREGEIKLAINVSEKLGESVSISRVAVDGTGHIYALDSRADAVLKFSPEGRFINRFGGTGDQTGQLRSPHGLAVDGQGRVYVSDFNRAVQVFDGNGRYLDAIGGRELVFGIVIGDGDEIFTSQRNRNKIVKYILNQKK
jgi:hypothetical protein